MQLCSISMPDMMAAARIVDIKTQRCMMLACSGVDTDTHTAICMDTYNEFQRKLLDFSIVHFHL